MIITKKQFADAWNNTFFHKAGLEVKNIKHVGAPVMLAARCEYFRDMLKELEGSQVKKNKRFLKTAAGCLWNEKKEAKPCKK